MARTEPCAHPGPRGRTQIPDSSPAHGLHGHCLPGVHPGDRPAGGRGRPFPGGVAAGQDDMGHLIVGPGLPSHRPLTGRPVGLAVHLFTSGLPFRGATLRPSRRRCRSPRKVATRGCTGREEAPAGPSSGDRRC
jgi:hypothetical protein